MQPLTLFSWGYWGWGNSPPQLIQAVDAVEAARGCAPPIFVDIRISRSVRAPGFNGRAFEDAVGSSRYRWLPDLDNTAVLEGGDTGVRLKDPAAAESLLEMAEGAARDNRRIVFFCACKVPGKDGEGRFCHRTRVASLLLKAAERRQLAACVLEWPGGDLPSEAIELELDDAEYERVFRGTEAIRLKEPLSLAEWAGLPWGTPLRVCLQGQRDDEYFRVLTGPARFGKFGWELPILEDLDAEASREDVNERAREYREEAGYAAREVGTSVADPARQSPTRPRSSSKRRRSKWKSEEDVFRPSLASAEVRLFVE